MFDVRCATVQFEHATYKHYIFCFWIYRRSKQQKRRKRIKKNSSSSDDDDYDKNSPKKHGRKNIRKMIRSSDLEIETKEAAKREFERKKRIEERQKLVRIKSWPNISYI